MDIRVLGKQVGNGAWTLAKSRYDYPMISLQVSAPIDLTCFSRPELVCKVIVVQVSNVKLSGINITGVLRMTCVSNVLIENCTFSNCSGEYGGVILVDNSREVVIDHVTISNAGTCGIFIENASTVLIRGTAINHVKACVCAANRSSVTIQSCTFTDCEASAVICQHNSVCEVSQSEFSRTYDGVSGKSGKFIVMNNHFQDIARLSVAVESCREAKIMNNTFTKTNNIAIVVSVHSTAYIEKNTFDQVNGNAICVSHGSTASIINNIVANTEFPAFGVQRKSSAQISFNTIRNTKCNGISIRGARNVVLDQNEIIDSQECGVSISETKNCVLMRNTIRKCSVAAVEAYDMSANDVLLLHDNTFEDCGRFAITLFTGAKAIATRNSVRNATEAMVSLRAGAGGEFTGNQPVVSCPEQYTGDTYGIFLFRDNGVFENVTNSSEKVTSTDKLVDKHARTPTQCFKCENHCADMYCVPCAHKVFCSECAKYTPTACPLCRFTINGFTGGYKCPEDVCRICLEHPINTILMPCGHIEYCDTCIDEWFSDNTTCPTCRAQNASYKIIELP